MPFLFGIIISFSVPYCFFPIKEMIIYSISPLLSFLVGKLKSVLALVFPNADILDTQVEILFFYIEHIVPFFVVLYSYM